jgi:proton-dependent oligopeptide transporter, POT family
MWYQSQSEWILDAKYLDLELWEGYSLLPAQVQSFNPAFLLPLLPVFTYLIYPFCERNGLSLTPLRKIGAGLVFTALSFVVVALLKEDIIAGSHPSVWRQILAYFILSCGEILVWVTCLEYAYTNSPKYMKSTMAAIGLLTVSLGNYLVALMQRSIQNNGYFAKYQGAEYYWFFVKFMIIQTIIFILVSKFIKEQRYVGED